MGDFGLVGIVFLIVPGFIADGIYRSTRGADLADGDFRIGLRSLCWSLISLSICLLVFGDTGGKNGARSFTRSFTRFVRLFQVLISEKSGTDARSSLGTRQNVWVD